MKNYSFNKAAYLDFDGTIVDVFDRYRMVLLEYLGEQDSSAIATQYKILKKQGSKDHVIAATLFSKSINIAHYMQFKNEMLEKMEYLLLDAVIDSPEVSCDAFRSLGYRPVLLTQRNYKDNLLKQLENLKISKCFDKIIVVNPLADGLNAKYEFLKTCVKRDDIIIGDSPAEEYCARQFGIDFYFVETGLFNSAILKRDTSYISCQTYSCVPRLLQN